MGKLLRSFRARTTALAVAALVFGMALAGIISFNNFQRYALDEQTSRVEGSLGTFADSFDRHFAVLTSALSYTAASDNFAAAHAATTPTAAVLEPMFDHFMDAFPDVSSLEYLPKSGGSYRLERSGVTPGLEGSMTTQEYQAGVSLQAGSSILSDISQRQDDGRWVARLLTPVVDARGVVVGVLAAELDLERVAELASAFEIGEQGYALASRGGTVVVHSDPSLIGSTLLNADVAAIDAGKSGGSLSLEQGSNRFLVNARYLPQYDLTLWLFADKEELLAPFMESAVQISVSMAIIVVASLVLIRLVMIKMSFEVGDLVRVSHDMSHGKLDARARTQTSREFVELAGSLNTMASTIETRTRDLEGSLRRLQESYHEIVTMLSMALEANDDTTQGHCARVELYSYRMGQAIGLPAHRLAALNDAALLHDVGKIGVPSWVLNKEGPLDEGEMQLMRRHPEIGHRILMGSAGMGDVADIVLQHHEWFNGAGYPNGTAGDDVLVEARILSIVDTYDAMTCVRPYRKQPLTRNQAVARLRAGAGTQFDPQLVDLFIELSESEALTCSVPADRDWMLPAAE